ncbi:cell wall hydrolase [Candidatus Saccharibacteria bacterium]|nr:cell wall hydrolase [Candidatus Saccharibacteria bacterium]
MVIKRIKAVSWCIILICFISILFPRNDTTVSAMEPVNPGIETANTMVFPFSEGDLIVLAKTLYGEANNVKSKAEKAMVIWCILNRYDAKVFGATITEICTKPRQFVGYSPGNPVTEENLMLVGDVVNRWFMEKNSTEPIGRTLPIGFYYFCSDSNPAKGEWHNKFYYYDLNGNRIYYDYRNPISNPY